MNFKLKLVGRGTVTVNAPDRDVAIYRAKRMGFAVAGQPR